MHLWHFEDIYIVVVTIKTGCLASNFMAFPQERFGMALQIAYMHTRATAKAQAGLSRLMRIAYPLLSTNYSDCVSIEYRT